MANALYQTAGDVFTTWRDDLLSGKPPILFPLGKGELARIECGPSLVTLFGGAPALARQPSPCNASSTP